MNGARLEAWADRLHACALRRPSLRRFAEMQRVLLSAAFFGPGLCKLVGERFASAAVGPPAYAFFEGLYQTGLYWRFLGLGQVLAAVLIVIPRARHLGALLFLPIVLNIWIAVYSMSFGNTTWIAFLMLLSSLFLVCWEYPRWKALTPWWTGAPGVRTGEPPLPALERAGYAVITASGWLLFSLARGRTIPFGHELLWPASQWLALAGALLVLISWARSLSAWSVNFRGISYPWGQR